MRILQVVTMLSRDGAFGGPARVAVNQSAELISRGHDVTLAAATRNYRTTPTHLDGVPVRLFDAHTLLPGTGFAGLGAPALLRWFRRHGREYDAVHIHFARDLVVLPVAVTALHRRIPYVLQTHGMVVPSTHPLAPLLDALWTRRVLGGAGAVFYLNELERSQLTAVARRKAALRTMTNGVPDYAAAAPRPGPPEILFAARLHSRKRPVAFVEMAKSLLSAGVDARFTLIGPDEGEGAAVRVAIGGEPRIRWEGPLPPEALPRRLASASVYVLPSLREPYPMAVLEAMSVGVPVVVSDDCGLAPLVERSRCGIVASHDVPALAAAVQTILGAPTSAHRMGRRGRAAVRDGLGMQDVGDRLTDAYANLAGGLR